MRRAGWGVALDAEAVTGGVCRGLNQSAYTGKLAALLALLRCLVAAAVGAVVFIDNVTVARGAKATQGTGGLALNTYSST